jgi:hypothetical protein
MGGLNLFRDIFPAARCVLLICFLSTTNTPQLAAGIFYFGEVDDAFVQPQLIAEVSRIKRNEVATVKAPCRVGVRSASRFAVGHRNPHNSILDPVG